MLGSIPSGTRPTEVDPAQTLFSFYFDRGAPSAALESAVYTAHLVARAEQQARLGGAAEAEVERRITAFIDEFAGPHLQTPAALTCPRPDGLTLWVDDARALRQLSFPRGESHYQTSVLDSYRVWAPDGGFSVLHNPKSDRRTTKGVNHIVDVGFPVPEDKIAVPPRVFAEMWVRALAPPDEQAVIPFTRERDADDPTKLSPGTPGMVKVLLHPVVTPEVPGIQAARYGEIVFVAPGGATIANLDFVSQVFGLAGDPHALENDLSWQNDRGSGLTGCIVVAPHLLGLTKKELGLPHRSEASERQQREGMCWEREDELYNDGQAFKLSARSNDGRVVTLIADNYFGYNKKEVLTELSYECNRVGLSQVEHSGGAQIARCVALAREYAPKPAILDRVPTLHDTAARFPELMALTPEGYARDRRYPEGIIYVPRTSVFSRESGKVSWSEERDAAGAALCPAGELPLRFDVRYTAPNGFTVMLLREKVDGHESVTLVGRSPELVYLHKPCTVSGGGKSELGKTIRALMRSEPFVIKDPDRDLALAIELCGPEALSKYFLIHRRDGQLDPRGILDPRRSVGSVIKLLTPGPDHTDEYNSWLDRTVPGYMRDLVCLIKHRLSAERELGDRFFVPNIDGERSFHLRERTPGLSSVAVDRQIVRFGWDENGQVRFFGRRPGNAADEKYAMQDDITVSTVVPAAKLRAAGLTPPDGVPAVKFVHNCERRLFQRPDDAFVPGADFDTEQIFATDTAGFFVNYEPLDKARIREVVHNVELLGRFHPAMQQAMRDFVTSDAEYFVCTAFPRIVDGKPTSNPRFLQLRPDLLNPAMYYHKDVALRLFEASEQRSDHVVAGQPLPRWVNISVPAHRLAPADPDTGLPTTAIWGMAHHLSGPAAVAKMICTFTPKSRATTGFGDEGALTKGPFNSMLPAFDINAAVIDMLLTRTPTFVTAAGFIGPKFEVDHDVTYAVSAILSRMSPAELDSDYLHHNGYLEPVHAIVGDSLGVSASPLGSRITDRWLRHYGGRIYLHPENILTPEMLRPELQDPAQFREGLLALWRAYQVAARRWVADGSYELAIPPVRKTLDIMLAGADGPGFDAPELAELFDPKSLTRPDSYYRSFLKARWKHELEHLGAVAQRQNELERGADLSASQIAALHRAKLHLAERLRELGSPEYVDRELWGTIGTDPGLSRFR